MKRHRKQPVPAEIVAYWRARYAALHQRLTDAPRAPDAWFWQIQCEIFNYFLNRYADGPGGAPVAPGQLLPSELDKASHPAPLEVRPSNSFTSPGDSGKMPRTAGTIRPKLANIIEGNRERYEQHDRLGRKIREQMRIELQRFREALRKVPFAELYEPSWPPQPEVEEGVMSEDEAFRLLTEMSIADLPPEEFPEPGEENRPGC